MGPWFGFMDVLKESVSSSDNEMVLSSLTLMNKVGFCWRQGDAMYALSMCRC